MTMPVIYFAGGEDVDFTVIGANPTITGAMRTGWSRCGVQNAANSGVLDPPANRIHFNFSTPLSNFWFHALFNGTSGNNTANGQQWIRFMDGANSRLMVRGTGVAGQVKVSKRTAAGVFTDLVTSSGAPLWAASQVHQLDIHVVYGVSGSVDIYFDGNNVGSFVGDTTTDGATTLSGGEFAEPAFVSYQHSELIVSDSDTRSMGLVTLNSTVAGATQAWTGTATNVNGTTINDANFISAATAALVQEYKPTTLPPGSFDVPAVVMSARAVVGASGPQHVDFITRIATTDFASADFAPGTSFGNIPNYIQAVNPATGVSWVTGDLIAANLQYGIKSNT